MVAVAVAAVLSGPAWAAQTGQAGAIQTNDPSGNSIVAFQRNADGTLALAASYRTGGNGGRASGAPSDPLTGATYDVDGGQQFTA